MERTDEVKTVGIETAKMLKGFACRRFQAQTVKALGHGGQRRAEQELGGNRQTLRKAMHELEHGLQGFDAISTRRRKRAEEHLPRWLENITAMVDSQSQPDPQVRSQRLSTRLTAAEVRRQLIAQHGYQDAALPTVRTILTKRNVLNDHPTTVAKANPQKNPETDAIFERIAEVNAAADADPQTLRISMDAKATVALGPFSRGGKSRVPTEAVDHDVQPEEKMTPVGMVMPQTDALFVYGVTARVPSDGLVDRIAPWWDEVESRVRDRTTLGITLDNGPEHQSRRTQCIQRLVDVVDQTGRTVYRA